MTELSNSILEGYQIRKSRKQKDDFIALLQAHFPQMTVQSGGFPRSKNLILGDVTQAKILLCAHYDTCARLPFPNFITPKNPFLSVLYGVLIALPIAAVMFIFSYFVNWLTRDFWINYTLCIAMGFTMLFLMLAGPANKHNANDNTSGVVTLCETYACLSPQERKNVAIVFFDNEELGLLGSARFKKQYRQVMKDKLLVNLDCVSDGDHILVAVNKAARKRHYVQIKNAFTSNADKQIMLEKAERVYYPSDQANFPVTVAIAALKHNKFLGYYMDRIHTRRDIVFDEKNITFVKECLLSLLRASFRH